MWKFSAFYDSETLLNHHFTADGRWAHCFLHLLICSLQRRKRFQVFIIIEACWNGFRGFNDCGFSWVGEEVRAICYSKQMVYWTFRIVRSFGPVEELSKS